MKVIVSGGFDPVHSGHIALFEEAAKYGDVIVLLNTDRWLSLKKGKPFLYYEERKKIIESLKYISEVRVALDHDSTVVTSLRELLLEFKPNQLIFANGGDRNIDTTPEENFCWQNGIRTIYGCGGKDKKNSSSSLLSSYLDKNYSRDWGTWTVFRNYDKVRLKELVVQPGMYLSNQRHFMRSELWFIAEGKGQVFINGTLRELNQFDIITIDKGNWHQLRNNSDKVLKVIEVQFGEKCDETDIERE